LLNLVKIFLCKKNSILRIEELKSAVAVHQSHSETTFSNEQKSIDETNHLKYNHNTKIQVEKLMAALEDNEKIQALIVELNKDKLSTILALPESFWKGSGPSRIILEGFWPFQNHSGPSRIILEGFWPFHNHSGPARMMEGSGSATMILEGSGSARLILLWGLP
jgi:hypothetical protein